MNRRPKQSLQDMLSIPVFQGTGPQHEPINGNSPVVPLRQRHGYRRIDNMLLHRFFKVGRKLTGLYPRQGQLDKAQIMVPS